MLYPNFKDMLMRGEVNLLKDKIWCVLSTSSFDNTSKIIGDINISSNTQELKGKSVVNGYFNANDINFGNVSTDLVLNSVILFTDNGFLMACIMNINGFPFVSNSNIINLRWNKNLNKILSI